MDWFQLERAFRGHPAQPPCREQAHLQLDQVAESPVQPDPECFQGWGINHLSGQPVSGFHHPQGEEFLPYIQSESPLVRLEAITPCPVTPCPCKKSLSIFLLSPL